MVFYNLQTVKDDKFPNVLGFNLDEISVAYHVPVLSQPRRETNFDWNDSELFKSGFPSMVGKGQRKLYTAKDGLRRLVRASSFPPISMLNMNT